MARRKSFLERLIGAVVNEQRNYKARVELGRRREWGKQGADFKRRGRPKPPPSWW